MLHPQLLAQCLVRKLFLSLYMNEVLHYSAFITGRKLFPESDCLKSHEREHMLYHELLNPRADIICLQVRLSALEAEVCEITMSGNGSAGKDTPPPRSCGL